ncbi:MAG: DUF1049 domain-containing protein [Candidatus Schekmanbacteria bacterium]|nr:DUF1049 domain-containing protein [Candidatus Schekmanbacteria bacterium]
MGRLIKVFLGVVLLAYLGVFMWANKNTVYVYYWPSQDAIIPILWYTTAGAETADVSPPHAESQMEETMPTSHAADAKPTWQPRPVPVFLLVLLALAAGYALCWALSAALLTRQVLARKSLQRKVKELTEQIDAMQKVAPPSDDKLVVAELAASGTPR